MVKKTIAKKKAPAQKAAVSTPAADASAAAAKAPTSKTVLNRRKKSHKRNFGNAIYKVLKEIHPDIRIAREAINIMNSLVVDMLDKILTEASTLMKKREKTLMDYNDTQSAVRLVLPGELAKHAMSEGLKALNKYKSSRETTN